MTTTLTVDDSIDTELTRAEVIKQYANPENQKYNNSSYIKLDLWSDNESFNEFVTVIELAMWGKPRSKRHDTLKVLMINLFRTSEADITKYLSYYRSAEYYSTLPHRYNPASLNGRMIKIVMDDLKKHGFIEDKKGHYSWDIKSGYISKARASSLLVMIAHAHSVEIALIRHPNAEIIELRSSTVRTYYNDRAVKTSGKPVDYPETDTVRTMRRNLESYNSLMANTVISYQGRAVPYVSTRRVFNGGFSFGGRFYGGFWQKIDDVKRSTITLNGGPVSELDYSAQHVWIAYAMAGVEPKGDLYEIAGIDREVVKTGTLRLLSNKSKRSVIKAIKEGLTPLTNPHGFTGESILEMIIEKHKAIKAYHLQGMALELMNIDSRICENILKNLTSLEIPCLNVYDSFIVPAAHKDTLRSTMTTSFQVVTNTKIKPLIKEYQPCTRM